jgi:DNA-binding NarL/FixJ family response regulator
MKGPSLNLFIVDDNKLTSDELKKYLEKRFGEGIKVLVFDNGKSCLENIDDTSHIVIVNNIVKGEEGIEILKSIKEINPKTKVIMLSDHESIGLAIASYRAGAQALVVKDPLLEKKRVNLISRIVSFPIRVIEKELSLPGRIGELILTFIIVAIVVSAMLFFIKK